MPSMGDHSFSGHGDKAGTAVGFLLHRKSIGKQLEIRLSPPSYVHVRLEGGDYWGHGARGGKGVALTCADCTSSLSRLSSGSTYSIFHRLTRRISTTTTTAKTKI